MYSAQSAAWSVGFSAFMILPLLAGLVLLCGAVMRPRNAATPLASRFAAGAVGLVFLGAGTLAVGESVALTHKCTMPSPESTRTVEGAVGPVEAMGKFGSQYYSFTIGSERFVSGARGVKSECGFRTSFAQSMYPPVGKQVQVRAVGSTIIELQVIK